MKEELEYIRLSVDDMQMKTERKKWPIIPSADLRPQITSTTTGN